MHVLGIETSCDETATAVVKDGRWVLSNVVFSQVALHRPYGGVVPEIASRHHAEHLPDLLEQAVAESGVGWSGLDMVAATYGPGLATSLLVGLTAGKALALRLNRPFRAINHLEAHLLSVFLAPDAPWPDQASPLIALIVSGGHTCLVRCDAPGRYRLLGWTRDDAAGEAFDKGAHLLGLGYPGGPVLDKVGRDGWPEAVAFPRARRMHGAGPLDFSFSGLKTALLYYLRDHPDALSVRLADVAASYQEAIVDVLVGRLEDAMNREGLDWCAVSGGVSLNSRLRVRLQELAGRHGWRLLLAPPAYCADNAAMVAAIASWGCGLSGTEALAQDACPSLSLGESEAHVV